MGEIEVAHQTIEAQAKTIEIDMASTRFFNEVSNSLMKGTTGVGQLENVEAFAALRRLWARGYKPAALEPQVRGCTMDLLRKRECIEIALLAAPDVRIEVVMPGEMLRLKDVRVQVEDENQHGKTDQEGRCTLSLRPGEKVLKLRHPAFASGWAEQELVVDGLAPIFRVPMTLTFAVWRSPIIIRGAVFAWEYWIAGSAFASQREGEGCEPYSGPVFAAQCGKLEAINGKLTLKAGTVEPVDDTETLPRNQPLHNTDPLSLFSLDAPFVRPHRCVGEADQGWQPRLLCTRSEPTLLPCSHSARPCDLLICARTRCCGIGVAGVQLDRRDPSEVVGVTGSDGVCILESSVKCRQPQSIRMSHPALKDGEEEFDVFAANTLEQMELPMFFDACVHLFTVEVEGGNKMLQAFAGGSDPLPIPLGARPFCGRLLSEGGREYTCTTPPNALPSKSIHPGHADFGESGQNNDAESSAPALLTRPLVLHTSHLRPGTRCPVRHVLESQPLEPGFEWCPADHLLSERNSHCGLQLLLKGALTLGVLRPVFFVEHVDGRRIALLVEEYPTASAAAARVASELGDGSCDGTPLVLGALDKDGGEAFAADDKMLGGRTVRVLCRLVVQVTFGWSNVGVAGADVQLHTPKTISEGPRSQGNRPRISTTGDCGCCELHVPAGTYNVFASHGLLAGSGQHRSQVKLSHVTTHVSIVAPVGLLIYALGAHGGLTDSPADIGCDKATSSSLIVWLSADPMQVPDGAVPVGGCLRLGPHRTITFDPSHINRVVLQDVDDEIHFDERLAQCLPVEHISLDCMVAGYIWQPVSGNLLDTLAAWRQLISSPVCVGELQIPVFARLHCLAEETTASVPEMRQLATEGHRRACDIAAALAGEMGQGAALAELGVFLNERLLAPLDLVPARSTVDVWPMAPINLDVKTQCCQTGVVDVSVRLSEDYLMSGQPFDGRPSVHNYGGSTDVSGTCCLMANVGEHQMHLAHPLLVGCNEAADDGTLSLTSRGRCRSACDISVIVPVAMFVSTIDEVDGTKTVWLCSRVQDVPTGSQPALGTLHCPSSNAEVSVDVLSAGSEHIRVRMPENFGNVRLGSECPLTGLSFEAEASQPLVWSSGPLDSGCNSCLFTRLAIGKVAIGRLKPAIFVICDGGGPRLRLDVETCHTVAALRARLSVEFSRPEVDIAIYDTLSQVTSEMPLDDADGLTAGQEVVAGFLAPLAISVFVPEVGLEEPVGLAGVVVEVDGQELSTTDKKGRAELRVRSGKRFLRLRHPCFGESARELHDIFVTDQTQNRLEIMADIRLYFYATDPERDEVEEEFVQESCRAVDPTLVWVCGSIDQIPEAALGMEGIVRGVGFDGLEVSSALSSETYTELVICSGRDVEAQMQVHDCCRGYADVTSLRITASRSGFLWRPKDPMPLVERAEELGGSEYLRLLDCPIVLGFLEPAVRVVHRSSGVVQELPVASHPTVAEVRTTIADTLGVSGERLVLFHNQAALTNDAHVERFSVLFAVEVAPITVRTLTGCCGEPVSGTKVLIDGTVVGVTDEQGALQQMLPLGLHELATQHHAFGCQPQQPMEIKVHGEMQTDQIIVPVHARLFTYATDPDMDEDEAPLGEDDEPLYDPTCVWVAANPDHIPDEILPLRGRVTCQSPVDGHTLRVNLDLGRVVPFILPLGPASPKPAVCPLGTLRLQCGRPGFSWVPKNPPPLELRAEELGGCELPRLLECPAALGFLKPAVTIQFAVGDRCRLPLDSYGEVQVLRSHLAEVLGESDTTGAALQLMRAADGSPVTGSYLKDSAVLICARASENLTDACKKLQPQATCEDGEEGFPCMEEAGVVEDLLLDESGALLTSH